MPKLAMLRITAYDDNNRQIGHRILPVESLRPGEKNTGPSLHQTVLAGSVLKETKTFMSS